MNLAFLHPLYEHSGSWASVHVDTSRHTEGTPDERHLTASALVRRPAAGGAVRGSGPRAPLAVRGAAGRGRGSGRRSRRLVNAASTSCWIRSAVAAGAPVLLVTEAGEETPAGGPGALPRRT
ncbi:hypothetical protein P1P75_06945 [Streptomyces sp. ID05-39B]|uniref:hypothetical protein n=1 Tax=Streptomyces sp. ID05-39B TaxID=3028664 RepID=UPI0029B40C0C|nr:hypothetical protein [Streptomyces sp. ID05-39B]MDX3526177.1 hypothetical protein [Streptomyces sp. ID05-39B]